jgi:hypothetical protein
MQSAWKTYHNHCDLCQSLLSSHSYLRAMKSLPLESYQRYITKTKDNSSPLELLNILSVMKNFKIHAWAVWKGRKEFRDTYIKNPDESHEYQINLYYSLMKKAKMVLEILSPTNKQKSTSSNSSSTKNTYENLEVDIEMEELKEEPLPNEEHDWTPCNLKVTKKPETISDDKYLDLFLKEKQLESLKFYILQFRVQLKIFYSYENCSDYFIRTNRKSFGKCYYEIDTKYYTKIGKFWTENVNTSMKRSSLSQITKNKLSKALSKVCHKQDGIIENFATFCFDNNLGFGELKEVADNWDLIVIDKNAHPPFTFKKDAPIECQIGQILNFTSMFFLFNAYQEMFAMHNIRYNPPVITKKATAIIKTNPEGFVFRKAFKEHFPQHAELDPLFDEIFILGEDGEIETNTNIKIHPKKYVQFALQVWDIREFRCGMKICFDLKAFINIVNQMSFTM